MQRAVIFDVDGTLVDTVDFHAEAWQRALASFGHDIPYDEIRSQIGKGGDQLLPALLDRAEAERHGEEMEEAWHTIFKADYMPRVEAFASVRELFLKIRADGLRIVLASSAKSDDLEIYKKTARIGDLIEAETSSDDAERSKPFPDIFQAALQRLGLGSDDAVVVGDSPFDAEAAGKAGIVTIGVLSGGFPENDLVAAGAAQVFADAADLLKNYDRSLIARLAG